LPDAVAAIRPAEAPDREPVARLLYESSGGMYDRYMGSRPRAQRVLCRAFEQPGNNASAEVVIVADVAGRIAGVLASFPASESSRRSAAFLGITLRAVPPWRWPGALWLYYTGTRATPEPHGGGLYVDALATDQGRRRRGVARALLKEAERQAAELGLRTLALDTALDNHPARALYLSSGFVEVAHSQPGRGLPGFVALVKELG
jgi:ribosomal protein S18 acetylase RimI-like enzyme